MQAGHGLGAAAARAFLHAEVDGLAPGREYFYRFRLGRYESATGRALTCPAPGIATPNRCASRSRPARTTSRDSFRPTATWPRTGPTSILTLGDYIYEDSWGDRRVRQFDPLEAVTLEDYRRRYTQYRTDPDLQAAHAACPWLVTWDDHEVDNDYVGLTSEHELCGGDGRAQGVSRAARGGLPGLVRAHAGAPFAPPARHGGAHLRRDRLGKARALLRPRHAPVPFGAGLPERADRGALRFREWPQDPVRRRGRREFHRPERAELQGGARGRVAHRARRRPGALARRRAGGQRGRLERARAERDDDDGRRGHGGIAAALQRRLGRLPAGARAALLPRSRSIARRIPSC